MFDRSLQSKAGMLMTLVHKTDEGFSFSFTNPNGWVASRDAAVTAVIAASSADCQVNATGFTIQ